MHVAPQQAPGTESTAPENFPQHIAIIMDGNGRWARRRGMPRIAGHKRGAEALRALLETCREQHIRYLTVYAFSAENWQRPKGEVDGLMHLLGSYLGSELGVLINHRIRLHVIGDKTALPDHVREQVIHAEEATRQFDDFHLCVCLSYGARQELTQAVKTLAVQVKEGVIKPDDITEERITQALFTCNIPEPDLLIRTGGEQRLSNFLLWQSAYTELYFSDVLWPDFTGDHLIEACRDYAGRERRYGRTGSE